MILHLPLLLALAALTLAGCGSSPKVKEKDKAAPGVNTEQPGTGDQYSDGTPWNGTPGGAPGNGATGNPGMGGTMPGTGGGIPGSGTPGSGLPGSGTPGIPPAGGTGGTGGAIGGGNTGSPGTGDSTQPATGPGTASTAMPAGDCGLDKSKLSGVLTGNTWLLVRNGKLCHENRISSDKREYVASVAKTFGAMVFGMVVKDTDGDLSIDDKGSEWGLSGNLGGRPLSEVLSMTAHTSGRSFNYDTVGTTQINKLSVVLNAAIKKHNLAKGLDDYAHNIVMKRLGMTDSTWSQGKDSKIFAYSLYSTAKDMARFGQLINNRGVIDGKRYLTEDWIQKQIHPVNESANGGYGLLTWLNAPRWKDISGTRSAPDLSCAPVVMQKSEFDAGGQPSGGKKDVGVWLARGMGGHFMIGHPGLNTVMVIKNYGMGRPNNFWQALVPVFADATGMDKNAFCTKYQSGTFVFRD